MCSLRECKHDGFKLIQTVYTVLSVSPIPTPIALWGLFHGKNEQTNKKCHCALTLIYMRTNCCKESALEDYDAAENGSSYICTYLPYSRTFSMAKTSERQSPRACAHGYLRFKVQNENSRPGRSKRCVLIGWFPWR